MRGFIVPSATRFPIARLIEGSVVVSPSLRAPSFREGVMAFHAEAPAPQVVTGWFPKHAEQT
eukprot:5093502-Amphidinium_carterae.1